jgi:hypothetical protein
MLFVPYSHTIIPFPWQILAQLLRLQAQQQKIRLSVEYLSSMN